MHELSVALSVVEMATREMKKNKANGIISIELEIGKLSGVQLDSLEFAWPIAIKGTALEQAERKIHVIPGKGVCKSCNTEFELEQLFDPCPNCGEFLISLLSGRELKLKSLIFLTTDLN